jgi:hypothetical protein
MSNSMGSSIRAHFDGKVIVPDQPLDLPVNTPLDVNVRLHLPSEKPDRETIKRRIAALEAFVALAVPGANIPDEALRRENMYGDDGR